MFKYQRLALFLVVKTVQKKAFFFAVIYLSLRR
nr:MAG TPA: hypothetical protein [Caudoviricetes sp.]